MEAAVMADRSCAAAGPRANARAMAMAQRGIGPGPRAKFPWACAQGSA